MKLVFDFGGVLFHWHPPSLMRRYLGQRVHDDASAVRWIHEFFEGDHGDWAEFNRGRIGRAGVIERIAARTGLSDEEVRNVVDGVPAELQPIAGTVDLLSRLHVQRYRLFFLSNMPEPYAERLEREHGFLRWFEAGVFSARVHALKPEPEIYALAAERFRGEPAEMLLIDDHPANVEAARDAGWQALRFESPAQCEAELRARGLFVPSA